jgi:hypothetical protein
MKLGYSEFSFGYAFTENLIRATPVAPHGAPIFPNLVQEAQLGYDVRLDLPGSPIFFQYKLPQLMSRNSAKEVSKKNLPGISAPFFRMPLMSKGMSNQHQRLIDLEGKFPGTVFYASPMMHSLGEFNSAYRAVSDVAFKSRFTWLVLQIDIAIIDLSKEVRDFDDFNLIIEALKQRFKRDDSIGKVNADRGYETKKKFGEINSR